MICAPVASASAVTSSPPTTSDSLLASARSIPSPSVATVGPSPAEPTSALSTRSAPDSDDQPHEALRAAEHLAVGPGLRGAGGGVLVGERDPLDAVGARLLDQRLPRALGRQADELELVAALAHVERLRADRAGRAEDQQALGVRRGDHAASLGLPGGQPRSPRSALTGEAAIRG